MVEFRSNKRIVFIKIFLKAKTFSFLVEKKLKPNRQYRHVFLDWRWKQYWKYIIIVKYLWCIMNNTRQINPNIILSLWYKNWILMQIWHMKLVKGTAGLKRAANFGKWLWLLFCACECGPKSLFLPLCYASFFAVAIPFSP